MLNAYLIEDVRALADLFKVNLAPKKSAHGQFTAYRVRHPEFAARQALVLLGVQSNALREPLPANVGREVHVSVEEGELFLYQDKRKEQLEIFGFDTAPHLEELIEPVARHHSEEEEHDVATVFWLQDAALMPEIVRRSLYLNNDRIQIATLTHGEQSHTLVRIESPSFYLLTWCQEQDQDRLTVFVPMTEAPGLYVQWGHRHPLSELWRRAWAEHQDRWIFFPAHSHYEITERPDWHSIYELTDFSVDISDAEAWRQVREEVAHFEVTLKLAPRHEPAPVEMLLLRDHDRSKLEDYLSSSDDADVDRLEISVLKDDDQGQWFFLREKHRGDGTLLLQLGGMGFARYKGFDNLLLPTTLVLEPQLRRDQYKKLFSLEPATLNFVVPNDDLNDRRNTDLQQARHIRIARSSFAPLKDFVDHIVHFERAALMEILEDSLFDLEHFKEAPSRAGMTRTVKKASAPRGNAPKERDSDDSAANRIQKRLKAAQKRRNRRIQIKAQQPQAEEVAATPEVNAPTELEILEADIERDLIRQGPAVELWQDLLTVKRQRQQWPDAIVCAIEGLWSVMYPLDGMVTQPPADDVVRTFKQGFTEVFEKAGQEPAELRPVAQIFASKMSANSSQALSSLMESAGQLRNVDEKISKKIRWLAWREILLATQDVRAQEEVRESLLTDLNKRGLDTLDSASFLRERILKDPELEVDDADLEDGAESSYVMQNIEVVEKAIEQLSTQKIRHASRASLARILAGMGMNARARDLIDAALEGMETTLGNKPEKGDGKAWTSRVVDFFRSRSSGKNSQRPERWHVWVALNAWLVFQRIEPGRAEDAHKAYEFLFGQLQEFEKKDMRNTAESLEARVGQQNVAEFLAIDSRSFFSSRALPDAMQKVVQGLEGAHQAKKGSKNKQNVSELVGRGIELAMNELTESAHPSLETVARLILEMVESLRRLKWDKEQRPVDQFEAFVHDLPTRPLTPEASRLYFAVLHCAAARALMDLGREKEAMARLSDILDWVGQDYMQVLDFVDLVKKEVLLAIELAPRNQRVEALRHLMNSLVAQEKHEIGDDPAHPGAGFEMPFQAYEIIQMVDHTLEAAISNEKLVLRRLRDFEEREEARIRYWVQRDQPAATS